MIKDMDVRCFYSPSLSIAITGGTGFIGRHFQQLSNDFTRINFGNLPPHTCIIHCAAKVEYNHTCLTENAAIDYFVFEQCKSKNHSILYCSTNNVYPMAQQCGTHTATTATEPYSLSKINGEILLRDSYRIPYGIIRIGDVFGKGQKHGNFFKALETSIAQQKPISLYGAGLKIRNYIWVNELTQSMLYLAQKLQRGDLTAFTVNAAYHETPTIGDIVNHVHAKTNLPIQLVTIDNDQSHKDLRTLDTRELFGYSFHYQNFWNALDLYIDQCQDK